MGWFSRLFGGDSDSRWKVVTAGDLYSVDDGEGGFQIAKVLVMDAEGVHVRLYKEKWDERPASVDVTQLSLGSVHDGGDFGIGHLPLSKKSFISRQPVLVGRQEVSTEELEGYEIWKENSGGYF